MSTLLSILRHKWVLSTLKRGIGWSTCTRTLHTSRSPPVIQPTLPCSVSSRKRWRSTQNGRLLGTRGFVMNSTATLDSADTAGAYLSRIISHPNVRVRDIEKVKQKLDGIFQGGTQNLHIISDFDGTLTRYWASGVRSTTSHAIVTCSSIVPQKLKDSTQKLYEQYYPIEVSHSMTPAEKFPHMEEWWRKVHAVLVDAEMKRDDIISMVQETPVLWRLGVPAMVQQCAQAQVPILVFSAGLADVILEVLRDSGLLLPNVHVISNKMIFEPTPPHRCIGFEEPIIHVFNKNESAIAANTDYFDDVAHRPNVLLMGDSLGDLKMSEGMKHDTCLTVGFLNHDIELLFPAYAANYDIIVLNDDAVQVVTDLLDSMSASGAGQLRGADANMVSNV